MSIIFDSIGRGICSLLINRPHKRNALNLELIKKLRLALQEFEEDDRHRVAILGGIGGNFCAGYDLNDVIDISTGFPDIQKIKQLLLPLKARLSDKKIVIAALDGHAAGFGFELALRCDFRIAERDARMGFMNRRFGIPIMNGGTVILPRLVGMAKSMELVATGKVELGDEALKTNLITYNCEIGCALGRSVNLARNLVKFPQEALIHDLNKIRDYQLHLDHNQLIIERTQALDYLSSLKEPLDLGVRFLRGEIGRHGNTDLGNLVKPIPEVTL